ncbi:MAG: DUF1934 domain-containing protein [Alistipes sp.]|nr:DUF1934 domain-containing protein [Alistipes sp.]
MNKNIMLSLTSIQRQDGDKTETELTTRAIRKKSGKFDIISYEDTAATGFEGSVTTIKTDGRIAVITREGTANSVLSLEVGRKHFCQYSTPFGDMQIGVYTHAIENTLEKDGRLYMKYTLDLNNSYLSDNEIIMKIN